MERRDLYRCCRCLRSRAMYGEPDERPGLLSEGDDTEIFWCTLTQSPLGPDDRPATPTTCGPGRACCRMG